MIDEDFTSRLQTVISDFKFNDVETEFVVRHCMDANTNINTIDNFFEEYTDHGVDHSFYVLEFGKKILLKSEANKWDCMIYVLSAFYHDIGMVISADDWEKIKLSGEFQRRSRFLRRDIIAYNKIQDPDPTDTDKYVELEYRRRMHGELSRMWIERNKNNAEECNWIEGMFLWDNVGLICESHCVIFSQLPSASYPIHEPIGNDEVTNILFLCAILRVSDIAHPTRGRALPYIKVLKMFHSDKSRDIWEYHGDVQDTYFDKDMSAILISAKCRTANTHRAIIDASERIEREIIECNKVLIKRGSGKTIPILIVDTSRVIPKPDATYKDLFPKFRIEKNKIIDLLMGSKLL